MGDFPALLDFKYLAISIVEDVFCRFGSLFDEGVVVGVTSFVEFLCSFSDSSFPIGFFADFGVLTLSGFSFGGGGGGTGKACGEGETTSSCGRGTPSSDSSKLMIEQYPSVDEAIRSFPSADQLRSDILVK